MPPGVTLADLAESAAQVKDACRIPIVFLCSSGAGVRGRATASGDDSVNSSMSSVYKYKGRQNECASRDNPSTNVVEEITNSLEGNVALGERWNDIERFLDIHA